MLMFGFNSSLEVKISNKGDAYVCAWYAYHSMKFITLIFKGECLPCALWGLGLPRQGGPFFEFHKGVTWVKGNLAK